MIVVFTDFCKCSQSIHSGALILPAHLGFLSGFELPCCDHMYLSLDFKKN
jgi:hypothetical protein